MRMLASVALMAVASLSACSRALLAPEDRKDVCRITVERKFDQMAIQPNPLSSTAGPAIAAAGGAAQGLANGLVFFPAAVVTVPLGAIVGAGYGAACAAGSLQHPTADADFERLFRETGADVLTQSANEALAERQSDCLRKAPGSSAAMPDAVLEIEKLEAEIGCLFGAQDYSVRVQWRLVSAKDGRVLVSSATRCAKKSPRTVDAWFADPEYARGEIARLLAGTGQRIAQELLDPATPGTCQFRAAE